MENTACIFANGQFNDIDFYKELALSCSLSIGVDGGCNSLYDMEISPDYIVGDMDSIKDEVLLYFKNKGKHVLLHPKEKNQTDTEIAIDFAKEKGFTKMILLGAFGDRIDHMLGNIGLLFYARDNLVDLTILDEKNKMYLLKEGINELSVEPKASLSFIAFGGEVSGITLEGFKYPLNNYTLKVGSSRCISNVVVSKSPRVIAKKGILIAIESRD